MHASAKNPLMLKTSLKPSDPNYLATLLFASSTCQVWPQKGHTAGVSVTE